MKQNLLKTMLVGMALTGTVSGAWAAEGNKRVLASQDYEAATGADWTRASGGEIKFNTGDAVYGNWVELNSTGSGNRSAYMSPSFSQTPDGYATADMTEAGYVIEFDAALRSGQAANRSQSQFLLSTVDAKSFKANSYYNGDDYLFALSQPVRDAASASTTWYINDLANGTGATVDLTAKKWYHFTLTVTAKQIAYKITDGTTEVASGQKENASGQVPQLKSFWTLLGRAYGSTYFDNLSIYDYTSEVSAAIPTITLTGVNGAERSYTIAFAEGETLHYQLPGESEYQTVSDGNSTVVKTSTSGTLSAYTTIGSSTSGTATVEVDATEITLNAPTYRLSGLSAGYAKKFTVSIDNSNLPLKPEAVLSYVFTPVSGTAEEAVKISNGDEIAAVAAGTYVITATAEGYNPSSLTINNDVAYGLTKEYNFDKMTETDFAEDLWEAGTDEDAKWGWSADKQATYYVLKNAEENASKAFDGLTLFTSPAPKVYLGYGLRVDYASNVTTKPVVIDGADATQYAVYTRLQNYGKLTKEDVYPAKETYNLYRYSDILRNIKVYSPITEVTLSVGSTGYATYTSPVAVDLTNTTGISAYAVKVDGDKAVLTKVTTIAAGEGVVLHSTEGGAATATAAVIASADKTAGNALTGVLEATTITDGYALATVNGATGFYKANAAGTVIPAGKAYLPAQASSAKVLKVVFDGETTGITGITPDTLTSAQGVYYNLNGQRIAQPAKGLYILNGKKIIKK